MSGKESQRGRELQIIFRMFWRCLRRKVREMMGTAYNVQNVLAMSGKESWRRRELATPTSSCHGLEYVKGVMVAQWLACPASFQVAMNRTLVLFHILGQKCKKKKKKIIWSPWSTQSKLVQFEYRKRVLGMGSLGKSSAHWSLEMWFQAPYTLCDD